MKLFDAHCHLQDPRILSLAPQLIRSSIDSGVTHFAVNGISEKDWHLVKKMSEAYPSVIPNFGVHPWFVTERTAGWFAVLREFFDSTPTAAVGEIGLDRGSKGKQIDFDVQVDVFKKQLELAKELRRPASVHCVRAFGDLLDVMKATGPFPDGVILHSYLGSAEMVPELARLGAYFSFSGFLMSLKSQKAKKMLKAVPSDRILLETDAPDALPTSKFSDLFLVEGDPSLPSELQGLGENPHLRANSEMSEAEIEAPELPKQMLNHPANIHNVMSYVASLLEMSKEELAEISYSNAIRLFSYEGSKVSQEERIRDSTNNPSPFDDTRYVRSNRAATPRLIYGLDHDCLLAFLMCHWIIWWCSHYKSLWLNHCYEDSDKHGISRSLCSSVY